MPTGQTRPACIRESMGDVVCKPYKSCKQEHEERNSPCMLVMERIATCKVENVDCKVAG